MTTKSSTATVYVSYGLASPLVDAGEFTIIIPPSPKRRAVVSVAFSAKDFRTVARAAREADMTLSAYIRKAVMENIPFRLFGPQKEA